MADPAIAVFSSLDLMSMHDQMSRRLVLPSLVAVAAAALSGWATLVGYLWTDYELANVGPFRAMADGHWSTFFHTAPVEGPSLLLRAPFVFMASLWGGGDSAIFRLVSVPGLLAGVVLGVTLWEMRARLHPHAKWSMLVVLLAAGNPVTLNALEIGHPEELMGAALCVGALLAALWDRTWLASVLLGLALANKAWAVLAIGPVLLALNRHHVRVLLVAGGIAVAVLAPFLVAGDTARGSIAAAGETHSVFQPWQVWWPLGEHGHVVRGMTGMVKPDYRAAPEWIGPVTHPLIAFLVVPISLLWLRARGTGRRSLDLLLLLALLFEARCLLDVANNLYYHVPFLMALLAWEALARERPPVLSLAAAATLWFTFERAPDLVSPDGQFAIYLVWALPVTAALVWATLCRSGGQGQPARDRLPWTDGRPRAGFVKRSPPESINRQVRATVTKANPSRGGGAKFRGSPSGARSERRVGRTTTDPDPEATAAAGDPNPTRHLKEETTCCGSFTGASIPRRRASPLSSSSS